MNHKKPILCTAVCTFLLIAFLIIPVNGKESDCYTLQISLRMICDESGTEAPLDSLDSCFYLLNADNQYLTGVYQGEIQSYVITGTADNSPISTVFQVKPESPGLIRVTGLSEGNYVLKEHYVKPKIYTFHRRYSGRNQSTGRSCFRQGRSLCR